MQTHAPDLFPETLLVSREGERIYTTSRSVAFHFGKRHDHVLRTIKKLLASMSEVGGGLPNFGESSTREADFGRRNFAVSSYLNEQNKPQPEYQLTHDGFLFLTMRFTGEEAMKWQITFVEAFRQQEAELAALQARYVAVLDQVRPHLRLTVQDFEAGLSRQATALKCGKSEAAITYRRSQARRFGLLPAAQRRSISTPVIQGVAA